MKVLFAAAEALPWYKTGGLADVARALPDALVALGHDVRLIMPAYALLAGRLDAAEPAPPLHVPWSGDVARLGISIERPRHGAPTVFLAHALFDVGRPYDDVPAPMSAGVRFALYCRAVAAYAREWGADVVHLNDWHTGLVPLYGLIDGLDAATLFSIHNLAYQGSYPPSILPDIDVPGDFFRTENGIELHGRVSFMKAGVALADRLSTVSPRYAREIREAGTGAGLEGLLHFRRRLLHGMLNGIDTAVWNPATDPHLPAPYAGRSLARKDDSRRALAERTGIDATGPILGVVSRLAHQKGIDILLEALPALVDRGCSLVVLGSGDEHFATALDGAAARWPGRVHLARGFDEPLAHLIYAGADFFLMPSHYEPCGLGQLIAQRYGTPPIARRTGGLADTIEDGATGFLFDEPRADAFVGAVDRALSRWRRRGWRALQVRCMREDHSWNRAAQEYVHVYELARGALATAAPRP